MTESLGEIRRKLDPTQPLSAEFASWYVDLGRRTSERCVSMLKDGEKEKVFIAGPIGAGKTTELIFLVPEFRKYGMKGIDVDISGDDLLSLDLMKLLFLCLKSLRKINVNVPVFSGTPSLHDLGREITRITREIQSRSGDSVVFILDELDRLDPVNSDALENIFIAGAKFLAELPVKMLCVLPVSITFHKGFRAIQDYFPNQPLYFPATAVICRDGEMDGEGICRMAAIVERRAGAGIFEADILDKIAYLSGGIPRDALSLAREACRSAELAGRQRPMPNDIDEAASGLRRRLIDRVRDDDEWILLRNIHRNRGSSPSRMPVELLTAGLILPYEDKQGPWYVIHPAIVDVVEAYRPSAVPGD